MNRYATSTIRSIQHHPRRALRIGLLTGSALRMTTRAAYAKRHAGRLAEPLKRAATDPKVHAETRRATADASRAAHRVRRVGPTRALTDKRVARRLRHATHHASTAAHLAVHPPRRHRARTTTITLLGTGMLAGAAYGGWKTYSPRSESESGARAADQTPTEPTTGKNASTSEAPK
jgi:hypothetical protein